MYLLLKMVIFHCHVSFFFFWGVVMSRMNEPLNVSFVLVCRYIHPRIVIHCESSSLPALHVSLPPPPRKTKARNLKKWGKRRFRAWKTHGLSRFLGRWVFWGCWNTRVDIGKTLGFSLALSVGRGENSTEGNWECPKSEAHGKHEKRCWVNCEVFPIFPMKNLAKIPASLKQKCLHRKLRGFSGWFLIRQSKTKSLAVSEMHHTNASSSTDRANSKVSDVTSYDISISMTLLQVKVPLRTFFKPWRLCNKKTSAFDVAVHCQTAKKFKPWLVGACAWKILGAPRRPGVDSSPRIGVIHRTVTAGWSLFSLHLKP